MFVRIRREGTSKARSTYDNGSIKRRSWLGSGLVEDRVAGDSDKHPLEEVHSPLGAPLAQH